MAETYADDGVSGTIPLHERPEGRRLLEDAQAGRFETLLVYRLDRLGRSLLVIVDAHDRLQEAGVALRSATEPIDTSTPSGRLIFQMLASFAEYDRQSIIERTRAGLRRAFKNGRHGGVIPYGYDIAPDGSFVVVEEEAAVVRQIIANIAEGGSSAYAETKRLNAEGVPSPGKRYKGRARTNGESWGDSSVSDIVNQRAYSGTHVVTLEGGETIERPVPAIVSPELQATAQAAVARNRRFSGGKPGREYLLRSLVYCERCGVSYVGGSSFYRRTGKRYSYYSCSRRKRTHDQRTSRLTCPHVNAEWLEGMVWADVRRFLDNPGEVLECVREQGLGSGIDAAEAQARLDRLQQRLAERREAKAEHVRAFVAAKGGISEDEFAEYTADLNAQIENLQLLISSAEADLAAHEEERLAAATTEAWLLTLRERLAEVEADTDEARRQRRELVELLVEKIIVTENADGGATVMITYRFGPPAREQGEPSEEISHGQRNSNVFPA